ncbi:MAG: hypothetical protein R2707_19330 [Acidimicrobiales bacterium]
MFRRVIAGLILGPALLIGSIAWWGFLSLRTVFDESRTETIAEELLDNEAVVDQIGANIGRALESAMPDSIQLTDAQVDAGVQIILTDPVVRSLIIDSLGTTHRAFLGLDDAPATIDLGPALASSRERIGAVAPTVAAEIPEEFEVELPTERIPDASPLKGFLERTVPLLAALSVVMALLALLTTSDRSKVLGKAARWAIGTTAFYLVVGLGVPYLLREFAPDQAEVLAALLTAVLRAALFPSIVLGGIGAVLLALSMFWPDGTRSRERTRRPTAAPVPAAAPSVPRPAPVAMPRTAPQTAPPPAAPSAPAPRPAPRPRPTAPDTTTAIPTAPAPSPAPAAAPIVRPPVAPESPMAPRPTLPTRAKPPDPIVLPAWTGDGPTELGDLPVVDPDTDPDSHAGVADPPKWRPPTWVEGHGWVMDPDDPRDPPNNARFVDGVGWVVPGPPPA